MHEIASILEGQSPGKVMWLGARGLSMYPAIRSGDKLRVVRCHEAELRRGDVAIVRTTEGALVAHLVVSTSPIVTAGLLAREVDEVRVIGLARVTAIRRGGRVIPVPRWASPVIWGAHLVLRAAWRSPTFGMARRLGLQVALSRGLGSARRRLLGPLGTRALGEADLDAIGSLLDSALSRENPVSLLRGTRTVGVFGGSTLLAMAHVDGEGRLHRCLCRRRARGLGLEEGIVRSLVDGGSVVAAEISIGEEECLAVLEARGFSRVERRGSSWVLMRASTNSC